MSNEMLSWPYNLFDEINKLHPSSFDERNLPTSDEDSPQDIIATVAYIFRHLTIECGTKKNTLGANFVLALYQHDMTIPQVAEMYSVSRPLVYAYRNNILNLLGRCSLYRNLLIHGLRGYVENTCKGRWIEGYNNGYSVGLKDGRTTRYNEESVIKSIRGDSPIEDCEFSIRTYNCLKRAGYNFVSQIIDLEPKDLLAIRNMGRKSADEVLCLINAVKEARSDAMVEELAKRGATREELDTVSAILNKYKEI